MAKVNSIPAQRIYPRRRIYLDYLAGVERLGEFYRFYPANEKTLLLRAKEVLDNSRARAELSKALLEYNQSIGSGQATLDHIGLLSRADTLAVVTGQQPGFLGGPLYDVYKAVTAIKLAKHLSRKTGQAVVPIFWIASEDSNFQGVSGIEWRDGHDQLRRIRVESSGGQQRQLSALRVNEAVQKTFDDFAELLPSSEFKQQWQGMYRPRLDEGWSRWFGRIMANLFAQEGLVLLEPQIVYASAGEIFQTAVSRMTDLPRQFDERTGRLIELGYEPQIQPGTRRLLYTLNDGRRQVVNPQAEDCASAELLELAGRHPERLSCSVLLRPIVQDYLLPTVAYVAGPAEIGYYAQLGGLYEQLKVSMPVIWPRASITLIEPGIARLISKSGLGEQELLSKSLPRPKNQSNANEDQVAGTIEQLGQRARESLTNLVYEVRSRDDSLEKFVQKTSKRVERDIDRLVQRGLEGANLRNEISSRQWQRIRSALWPGGQPQERAFGLFGYLVYYGQAVLEEIFDGIDIFDFSHRLLYLEFHNEKPPTTEPDV